MKKVLLSLAAISATLSANAQLLNYGFETSDILPGQVVSENWSDVDSETGINKFENCQFLLSQENTGIDNSNSLWVTTDVECQPWQRVIAFTNVGLQENTSYRISLWVKGKGDFNLALLKGCFNHDCALQAGNGETYVDQTTKYTAENESEYVRYSYVVWSPSREVMSAKKEDFKDDTYWNQDFLRLSFVGAGTLNVDNIKIEESTVKNVAFNGNVVRVDFGYATNAANLEKEAGSAFILDPSCVEVKIDGEPAAVSSVEIKDGGNFYIFLVDYPDATANISVSFTNPGSLKYTTNVAPDCFTKPNCAVYDFKDEPAFYNEELTASSVEWEEAALVTSDPLDESFEYEGTINTFLFTFDKPVSTFDEENEAPIAFLYDETGKQIEKLAIQENAELSKTLVVTRTSTNVLPDGVYTVTLDNVSNANHVATTTPFSVSFEVGVIEVAETKYTPCLDLTLGSEDAPAIGWTIYNEGQVRDAAENSYGSGPRRFDFTNSTVAHAAYFRTKYADNLGDPGVGYVSYGDKEGYEINLPAGNIAIRPILAAWKNPGFKMLVEVIDAASQEVILSETTDAIVASADGKQDNVTFEKPEYKIKDCKGGKFIFRVSIVDKENQHEALCGGFEVDTYEVTNGHIPDPITILKQNFAEWSNNVPAAESGWQIYDKGAALTSNTGASRIMATSPGGGANLANAYFCRHWEGDNLTEPQYYLIYGDNTEYPDQVINIEKGGLKYEVSYYAAIWNAAGGTMVFQILDMNNTVVLENRTELTADFKNSAQTVVTPDHINLIWEAEPGKYKLKAFGTSCTLFGNVKIEYPGKKAVKYISLLRETLAAAEAELKTALENPDYVGTTLDNLQAAIKNANVTKKHHSSEYEAVVSELNTLISAMAVRRKNVNSYSTTREDLAKIIESCDGEKVNLSEYKNAVQVYEVYKDKDVRDLNDEALANALSEMEKATKLLKNQTETIIPLLTKQITTLVDLLKAADPEKYNAEEEVVIAAGKLLRDSQTWANVLKRLNTAYIYQKIADGYNFTKYDELTNMDMADSLDVTGWIQNSVFYCNAGAAETTTENFPGWSIVTNLADLDLSKGGYIKDCYGWEGKPTSADNPVADRGVYAGGNNNEYVSVDVSQQLSLLPVGTFTYYIETCDRTGRNWNDGSPTVDDPDPMKSYVYYFVSEDNKAQQQFAHVEVDKNQWYPLDKNYMRNISVPATGNYATFKIGANLMPFQDKNHGEVDNAKLYMTGKDPNFDYGAAAEAVRKDATDDIQQVEVRTDAPVAVSYFNMAGQQMAAPKGVSLKVESYSDGYVVVKKVLVK